MTFYRILECATCGAVVADFGWYRVGWPSGEAHHCAPQRTDALDDLTAQALAGDPALDVWVAETAEVWLEEVTR